MAAENKTKLTGASVAGYIAAIKDATRRKDCAALVKLMKKVTGQPAKMWGPSIIGFGSYHYKYESGREGDICLAGFSSRKDAISIYLSCKGGRRPLLAKLGKHKMAKACLSVKRLADVDVKILEKLVAESLAETQRRYG